MKSFIVHVIVTGWWTVDAVLGRDEAQPLVDPEVQVLEMGEPARGQRQDGDKRKGAARDETSACHVHLRPTALSHPCWMQQLAQSSCAGTNCPADGCGGGHALDVKFAPAERAPAPQTSTKRS